MKITEPATNECEIKLNQFYNVWVEEKHASIKTHKKNGRN